MNYSCLSDIGLNRNVNQDRFIVVGNRSNDYLALVCDGIGGANAGEVASGNAIEYFREVFVNSGPFKDLKEARDYMLYHLRICNSQIYELSRSSYEYNGMGTTLTGLLICKYGCLSINVGDSRVYGFLDDKLFRLTIDHTLVNELLQNGEITYEESLTHPKRHYLIRALGVWDHVDFDIHKVKDMDRFLLCSDGLSSYVTDQEIRHIMIGDYDCEQRAKQLIDIALLKGGYDNITVIVVDC